MTEYVLPARLLEARRALLGDSWSLEETPTAGRAVAVHSAKGISWIELKHDVAPAPEADHEFVAAARSDAEALLDSLEIGLPLTPTHLEEIARRHERATPGPWAYFLESDGGIGGCNVITMGGSEADLYVYMDGRLAPDPEWIFVALAHSEIARMVDAVRGLESP